MRKRDWSLLIDVGLALKDLLASNYMQILNALVLGPVQRSVVKVASSGYTGKATLASARALSKRTPDGAFIEGPVATGYFKVAFRTFPPNGKATQAFRGKPHVVDDFNGTIEEGYGKGEKKLVYKGNAVVKRNTWHGPEISVRKINIHIHKAERAGKHWDLAIDGISNDEKQIEINIPSGDYKGRYTLITVAAKGKDDYMLCVPMKDRSIVLPKPSFKLISLEKLEEIDATPDELVAEWKPDGGMAIANVVDGRAIFTSHREEAPAYYDKLPQLEWLTNRSHFLTNRILFPNAGVDGTVMYVELFHPEGAARVGGIVNANADNSINMQQERGPVTAIIWDVMKYQGKDISKLPFEERMIYRHQVVEQVQLMNPHWSEVPWIRGGQFMDFYQQVIQDKRGLPWAEGIVVKKANDTEIGGFKVKHRDTYDAIVTDVLEGTGKYAGTAGKLVVKMTKRGPEGEVGSLAVPDIQRDWIWDHRNDLPGQVAEIFAQEVTKAGVPRAGVFIRWHPSKSDVALRMYSEGLAGTTDKEQAEPVMYALKSARGWRAK